MIFLIVIINKIPEQNSEDRNGRKTGRTGKYLDEA